jgi:hypothetical protein
MVSGGTSRRPGGLRFAAICATAVLTLAAVLVAAGCGGGSRHTTPPTTASSAPHSCPLSAAQHRDVAKAKRVIIRMHRLEQPLKTVHPTGPPSLENAVNRFLLDVGPLPPDIKGQLMDLGKSATGLCQDCSDAIEAEEPAVQTRLGGPPCAAR